MATLVALDETRDAGLIDWKGLKHRVLRVTDVINLDNLNTNDNPEIPPTMMHTFWEPDSPNEPCGTVIFSVAGLSIVLFRTDSAVTGYDGHVHLFYKSP